MRSEEHLRYYRDMGAYGIELSYFILANARASAFGAYLLFVLLLTHFVPVPFVHTYDTIFIAAVGYQFVALASGREAWREFVVIAVFHMLATIMELFKTHPAIGSWAYPDVSTAIFAIGTVPLFTGFLYSAVGSYISRAIRYLHLYYVRMPAQYHVWVASALIYINFFTHHVIYDARYIILVYLLYIFGRTTIYFKVYTQTRRMPFLVAGLLTAICIWIAENIGTFAHVWLYPNQTVAWHMVSVEKIGSWFLLLILSFALVLLIYRDRITQGD